MLSAAEQWLKLELTKNFKVRDSHSPAGSFRSLTADIIAAYSRPGLASATAGPGLVKRVPTAIRWDHNVNSIVMLLCAGTDLRPTGYGHGHGLWYVSLTVNQGGTVKSTLT